VVIGQNPASNHPRMMAALYEARKRGARIIAINPMPERGFTNFSDPKNIGELIRDEGIAVADEVYQVQVGGDLALFKGVMKALLELEGQPNFALDRDFIKQHTEGYDALRADLEACDFADLAARSGIDVAKMQRLAQLYADSRATMFTWCMGLTHHPEAVATIQQVVNLALLMGNIGRRGTGVMPVRGHSNVQGDRTMGATSTVSEKWLDNLECAFTGLKLSRESGRDAAATIQGLFAGQVRALLSLGGNFGVASPDAPRVQQALSRCRFTLHIATKLNRTHCFPGETGLLLPTLGRTDKDLRGGCEQTISTEDSSSTVRASHGLQHPISELQRSEPAIVAQLAHALGIGPMVPWLLFAEDYAALRERIEQVQCGITAGFDGFNDKLSTRGRFSLPNAAAERHWKTPSGKAQFRVHAFDENTPLRRARREHGLEVLALMTVRAHDQFNTTVYSQDDRYRDVGGDRRVVFLPRSALLERGIGDGEKVDIEAICDDGIERIVHGFTARQHLLPDGCAAAYYPEASGLISSSHLSSDTHTPLYKEMPVRIRRSAPA
jgi:molybdopterin-dependent oxidoreductase alpha subunit